jgi:ribonuclease HII
MAKRSSDSPSLFELPVSPDFSHETRLYAGGCLAVAGTDEAGRGPLAGPVVAAAVVLDIQNIPFGLDDSKRLKKSQREQAFTDILAKAKAIAFCSLSAEEIDRTDIRKASLEAMRRAVAALSIKVDHVLVDGRDVPPGLSCPATALINGDQRSLSIAAASIVAKVMRDRGMHEVGTEWIRYGFGNHAGYGTKAHTDALAEYGPLPRIHRFTFAPIRTR